MDNFSLPICPKCNDTKNVRNQGVKICYPPIYCYSCDQCKINWAVQIQDEKVINVIY